MKSNSEMDSARKSENSSKDTAMPSCLDYVLEGEKLCAAGKYKEGETCFKNAVKVGTDDLTTLSSIYNHLGNIYFIQQDYAKALEFHQYDLNMARITGDLRGEAKACGGIGNTLKNMGRYKDAVKHCKQQLKICRELENTIGEARALYNLGNIYHKQGKQLFCKLPDEEVEQEEDFPDYVTKPIRKAVECYKTNLDLVTQLSDRRAEGRAYGNLGNAHLLLQEYEVSKEYHYRRLIIAQEFRDRQAERRAFINLGNVHILLGNFEKAAEHYKYTVDIARELKDVALEAHAYQSLGDKYLMLRHYEEALKYHAQHLAIVEQLDNKAEEESRACWSLCHIQVTLGNLQEALKYAQRHLQICMDTGDEMGQGIAETHIKRIQAILEEPSMTHDASVVTSPPPRITRRQSMLQMTVMQLTPADQRAGIRATRLNKDARIFAEMSKTSKNNAKKPMPKISEAEEDDFFELLLRHQSRRIDEQRCSYDPPSKKPKISTSPDQDKKQEMAASSPEQEEDDFLDLLASVQGSRMDDQRVALPRFPGLNNAKALIAPVLAATEEEDIKAQDNDDDAPLLDQDKVKTNLLGRFKSPGKKMKTRTSNDSDEDFFSLLHKVQSDRIDEQRCVLPPRAPSPTKQPAKKVKTPKANFRKKKSKWF